MANNTGGVIQGSFVGGQPRIPGVAVSPPGRPMAGVPPIQPRMAGPTVAQQRANPSQALPPHANRGASGWIAATGVRRTDRTLLQRSAQPNAAVQRTGTGEAFQLPAALQRFGGGVGQKLPDPVRQKMESFFNTGFADVRVHLGPQAASIGALAFAQGSDLYFAPGHYDPNTARGQRLLGHELAHVVQQRAGRVRNPFGSGIAVVHDRNLESEAERMGERAVSHQGAVQAKSVNGPAAIRGGRPAAIQRSIYRFEQGRWKLAQLGTKGKFALPDDPIEGEYFNDINRKRSHTLSDVRAGLSDLMMITGSLEKDLDMAWPDWLWDALYTGTNASLETVGTITLASGKNPRWSGNSTLTIRLPDIWREVLCKLMDFNGQLPYIERQSWFTDAEAEVDIEVNFYKDRDKGAALAFHKDTAGDNLFVNLVFNNKLKMPATEWIEDLNIPLAAKRREMKRLMPGGMEAEIDEARTMMAAGVHRVKGKGKIRGGIAKRAAFVSWVDDLVWHATPSAQHRQDVKVNSYQILEYQAYYWTNPDYTLSVHRGLRYLASFPDTLIARYGRDDQKWKHPNIWGFTSGLLDHYVASVGHRDAKGANYAAHIADITKYKAALESMPIQLEVGQELAPDPGGVDTLEFNKATGITGRTRRTNSVTGRAALEIAETNNPKRSFLRTWVRIRKV
jgi:hypothetical protein